MHDGTTPPGIWKPGHLWVGNGVVYSASLDPLATWHPVFDQDITQWKSSRAYVDARDVTPENFQYHPSHLLGPEHENLSQLLQATPVFALGDNTAAARQGLPKGARVYTLSYHRVSDPVVSVTAEGTDFEHSASVYVGSTRANATIDRIAKELSDGRLSIRSLDLAEFWSSLAGGPAFYVHADEEERETYLRMWEEELAEAHADADSRPAELGVAASLADAIEAQETSAGSPWGSLQAHTEKSKRFSSQGEFNEIRVDGRSTLEVPEETRWRTPTQPAPFASQARKQWLLDAPQRSAKWAASRQREAQRARAPNWRVLFIGLSLMIALLAALFLAMPTGPGGGCREHSDCNSRYCRTVEGGSGYCTARCRGVPGKCSNGEPCRWDEQEERSYCPP